MNETTERELFHELDQKFINFDEVINLLVIPPSSSLFSPMNLSTSTAVS
jgi:hypothetical protein